VAGLTRGLEGKDGRGMAVVTVIEYLAVIAAAIYGVLLASWTGMDFVGSFAGAWVYIVGELFHGEEVTLTIISAVVVVVFRLLAVRFILRFPPLLSS
jgi:uncharacterized membrane protein YeiH